MLNRFTTKDSRDKTLILHIGMHKTGTTGIQTYMRNHETELASLGINYLAGIHNNHGTSFISLFGDKPPHKYFVNVAHGINTPKKATAHNSELKKRIVCELRNNVCPTVVISGEGLSMLSSTSVQDVHEFISPYFDKIKVICYVRDPIGFYHSMSRQYILGGRTKQALSKNPPKPGYRHRIEKFVEIFGANNVTVKKYDNASLTGGDAVIDFLTFIGMGSDSIPVATDKSSNTAVSASGIHIVSVINEMIPRFKNNKRNPQRSALQRRAFREAAAMTSDPQFEMPILYSAADLHDINADIEYVNSFLDRDEQFSLLDEGILDTANLQGFERLDIEYVACLVNQLQLMANRRQRKIRRLQRELENAES